MQLQKLLSAEILSGIKRSQFAEKLLLSDTVPAGQEKRSKVNISHLGDFYCLYITGRYTTLEQPAETVQDNGVCSLRGQLIDGTGNRKLFDDYIPFDLWLSPGRTKSILSAGYLTDDPAQQLFYPFEFQNLFDQNSTIVIYTKNDATYANSFDICFHGIRILKGK